MNGIVNGSVLKFKSTVTIPASGSGFATLKFLDPLSEGLEYVTGSAVVTYNNPAVAATGVTVTSDPITRILKILITDPNIVAPTTDTSVSIEFKVKVLDMAIGLVNNVLTNNYSFSMLDAANTTVGIPVSGVLTETVPSYQLFVMGVPSTINRVVSQAASAIYFFGALSGYGNADLDYSFLIQKTTGFDFPTNLSTVTGTIETFNGTPITGFNVTDEAGNLRITFPFDETFHDKLLFINIPLTTNTDIATVVAPALVYGDGALVDAANAPLVTAHNFSSQVNLVDMVLPKSLTGNTKTLMS